MSKTCKKCGYYIEFIYGAWCEVYDQDDICYDEDGNMIGDGNHYPED